MAGVLGEAEPDLESTELAQDEESSEKMLLVPPPGGFRTLKCRKKLLGFELGS